MGRVVTSRGRSGRQVTSFSRMVARVITAMGGRSAHVVHGRSALSLVTGVGAATLVLLAAAHSSASPPLGEDVSGVGASTLTMGAAAMGTVIAPVSGLGSAVLTIGNEGHGLAFGSVTGTGAATLDLIASGEGSANGVSGVGASTLTLLAAGSGTHLPLVTGAGSTALTLTASASGTFLTPVVGVGSAALTLIAAGTGTGTTSAPASVATPVAGTDLTSVWNLQLAGATGPRYAFTNGTWAGSIDAYLTSKGVIWSNVGALYWDVGATTNKTIDNYDFGNAPVIYVNGTGTAAFNDCAWNGSSSTGVNCPRDINGTFLTTASTLAVSLNYCTLDKSITYMSAGSLIHTYCRFKNQIQILSSGAFNSDVAQTLGFDHCYITGGGVAPAAASHVELIQQVPNAATVSGCVFYCTNTMLNFIDGQASTAPWGSAWTGVWSVGKVTTTLENNIFIGIIAVNANPANPDVINCILAYGTDTGTGATLTNNVMEGGRYGYTLNQNATANRAQDGGGNRDLNNTPLTIADFG